MLGARPDRHLAHRGPDGRAEARLHDRHRDPQHAAGRPRLGHDRVLHHRRGRGLEPASAASSSSTGRRRSSPARPTNGPRATSPVGSDEPAHSHGRRDDRRGRRAGRTRPRRRHRAGAARRGAARARRTRSSSSTPTASSCCATTPPSGSATAGTRDALAEEQINELLDPGPPGPGRRAGAAALRSAPRGAVPAVAAARCANGAILGAVVFIRDISETRRTRERAARLRGQRQPRAEDADRRAGAAGRDDGRRRRRGRGPPARRAGARARPTGSAASSTTCSNLSLIEAQESPSREPVPIAVLIAEAVDAVRPAADAAGHPAATSRADLPRRRGAVRSAPGAERAHQPARQRDQVLGGRRARWRSTRIGRRRHGHDHGHRPRPGHPVARSRADLRAVLPGRPGPQPGDRRHRPRARRSSATSPRPTAATSRSSHARAKARPSGCASPQVVNGGASPAGYLFEERR